MKKIRRLNFENYRLKIIIVTCAFFFKASVGKPQHWGSLGSGLNNGANVIVYDSLRGILYAFGSYASDTVILNYCAQWDGSNWTPLGIGNNDGNEVNEACMYKGDLYVGGYFKTIGGIECNGIARWNGSDWLPVGIGFSAGVQSFATMNNELYIATNFGPTPGFTGIPGFGLFKWDGASMQVLDTTSRLAYFHLINYNDTLYTSSALPDDTILEDAVRKWTGITWEKTGADFNRDTTSIFAISVFNSELYVAGVNVSDVNASLYKWDGTDWRNETPSINGYVNALQEFDGKLYVAGLYDNAGSIYTRSIATWDGLQWATLADSGIFGNVISLAVGNNLLYAGGIFGRAGNIAAKGITYYSLENLPPVINTSENYIVVYPNPSIDQVVIDFVYPVAGDKTLRIYNSLGETVAVKNVAFSDIKIEISVSELAQGNYFIEVEGDEKKYYSKLLKL